MPMADEDPAPRDRRPKARADPAPGRRVEPGAAPGPERPRRRADPAELSAAEAARCAARQVAEFTGRELEAVVAIERVAHGWRVSVEVVETSRIPDSADILAIYDTELHSSGELVSYRRVRRYSRGSVHGEPR
jgi:hypothetical protein